MKVSPFAGVATAPRVPRWLVQAYAILAIAALARSSYQLATDAAGAPVAYGLSAVAAGFYLVAAAALARSTRSMRALGAARLIAAAELAAVVTVGAAGLLHPAWFPRATVWSGFGSGYGLAPLLLPAFTLWRTRAR
ncbi:MAG: hypothetical protein PGN13_00825 [Patulibacter minatonensis]